MATSTKLKKKPATTKHRPKRPRQHYLPGTEPVTIPSISQAAQEYMDVRDGRMEMTKTEVQKHEKLLGLMKEHKLETYEFDGFIVSLFSSTKVKVKRKSDETPEEDGAE